MPGRLLTPEALDHPEVPQLLAGSSLDVALRNRITAQTALPADRVHDRRQHLSAGRHVQDRLRIVLRERGGGQRHHAQRAATTGNRSPLHECPPVTRTKPRSLTLNRLEHQITVLTHPYLLQSMNTSDAIRSRQPTGSPRPGQAALYRGVPDARLLRVHAPVRRSPPPVREPPATTSRSAPRVARGMRVLRVGRFWPLLMLWPRSG